MLILGGWYLKAPMVMLSNGHSCKIQLPEFLQGTFADAAAARLEKGVLLCGGNVGTREIHAPSRRCYYLDRDFPEWGFVPLSDRSDVPALILGSGTLGGMTMVSDPDHLDTVYLYVNSSQQFFQGSIRRNRMCQPDGDMNYFDYLNEEDDPTHEDDQNIMRSHCSRIWVDWKEIRSGFTDYGGRQLANHPCMVWHLHKPYILGGVDRYGHPIKSAYYYDRALKESFYAKYAVLPSAPRVYHACMSLHGSIWIAGGVQHHFNQTINTSVREVHADVWKEKGNGDWTQLPRMIVPRASFGLVALAAGNDFLSHRIFAVGGIFLNESYVATMGSVEEYSSEFGWERCRTCMEGVKLARFAYVVLPFDFFEDCHCVPHKYDPTVCLYVINKVTEAPYEQAYLAPKNEWLLGGERCCCPATEYTVLVAIVLGLKYINESYNS